MQPDENPGPVFISIERVVAFIVGPIVVAGAGWLSTFLATEAGVHVDSTKIVGFFAVGGLAAGALAYKWLHGRQIEMQIKAIMRGVPAGLLPGGLGNLGKIGTAHAFGTAEVRPPSGEPPIPPAQHDPAPAGGAVADAGAATGQ